MSKARHKKRTLSRGWSSDHTRRPITSKSTFCNYFWLNLLISYETLSHTAGNRKFTQPRFHVRIPVSHLNGMDPKWVHSIFVVSMYELDQITKMQIERVRVR